MSDQLSVIGPESWTLSEWIEADRASPQSDGRAHTLPLPECERFVFWQQLFAAPAVADFDERLSVDGLTKPDAQQLFGTAGAILSGAGPRTMELATSEDHADELRFIAAAHGQATGAARSDHRQQRDSSSRRWPDAIQPFLATAQTRLLTETLTAAHRRFIQRHLDALIRPLVSALEDLFVPLASAQFANHRQSVHAVQELMGAQLDDQERILERWNTRARSTHFVETVDHYPAAARLAARLAIDWVKTTCLFVQRVCADWPTLTSSPGFLSACDAATADGCDTLSIEVGLSDRHNGGRTVCRVTSADQSVYYKPRPIGVERVYNEFLRWLTACGAPMPLPSLRILDRDGYGWAEGVVHTDCVDEHAVHEFYRSAGGLLFILDMLGAVDAHGDNIVATRTGPVFVDAEAVMHLRRTPTAHVDSVTAHLAHSVLGVGMLPRLDADADITANSAGAGLWTGPASAAQRFSNAPVHAGRNRPAHEHVDEICAGYAAMHRFAQRHRTDVLTSEALQAFRGQTTRYIFRGTSVYASALDGARDPRTLRSGLDRSLCFELLAPAFTIDPLWRTRWWMHRSEIAALSRGDVPHFTSVADKVRLDGDPNTGIGCFERSGFALTVDRIRQLDDVDLTFQLSLIRQTLAPATATPQPSLERQTIATRSAEPTESDERFTATARELIQGITSRALTTYDGHIGWLGARHDPMQQTTTKYAVGPDLYSGLCGIACALATFGASHDDPAARLRAEAIVAGLDATAVALEKLATRDLASQLPIGISHGAAGIIVGLVSLANLVEAPARSVAQRYARLAVRICQGGFAPDKTDLLRGSAGLLLALMPLSDTSSSRVPNESFIDDYVRQLGRAERAAERQQQVAEPTGQPSSLRDVTLGHGTVGRAIALARFSRYAGDSTLCNSAEQTLTATLSTVTHVLSNRRWACEPGGLSWCNGLVGAGFTLLAFLQCPLTASARRSSVDALRRICAAIETTPHEHGTNVVCCGHWGAVELLIEAGQSLKADDMHDRARSYADRILTCGATMTSSYNPGLFQGDAGVALTLLRLCDPAVAPSPLNLFGLAG